MADFGLNPDLLATMEDHTPYDPDQVVDDLADHMDEGFSIDDFDEDSKSSEDGELTEPDAPGPSSLPPPGVPAMCPSAETMQIIKLSTDMARNEKDMHFSGEIKKSGEDL